MPLRRSTYGTHVVGSPQRVARENFGVIPKTPAYEVLVHVDLGIVSPGRT
jgi:hypothetical protein